MQGERRSQRNRDRVDSGIMAFAASLLMLCASVALADADAASWRVPSGPNTQVIKVGQTQVYKTTGPDKRLDFVVLVPATVDDVWNALTTVEGVRSFFVPDAKIELWPGGAYELYYKPDAPPGERGMEGTRVLSLVPGEMLAGTGSAPPQFPIVRERGTYWVTWFDDAGDGKTLFHMSLPDWPEGEEWDGAFEYLAKRNTDLTEALYKRFAEGPVDWSARGVKVPASSDKKKAESDDRRYWRVDKSLVVQASPERIWEAFTTRQGLEAWAAPYVNIELKVGGAYELFERPSEAVGRRGQEGTKVLAYVQHEMLSHTWLASERHSEVREGPAWVVWRFEPQPRGLMRIRYTALGLGQGKPWQDAFNELDIRMDFRMFVLRDLFQ